jgi:hypothetical protein
MSARDNTPVEHSRARHIGDIIRERNNLRFERPVNRIVKSRIVHRLLLNGIVWIPLTIGRIVTWPFISNTSAR